MDPIILLLMILGFEALVRLPTHTFGLGRKGFVERSALAQPVSEFVPLAGGPGDPALVLAFVPKFVAAPAAEMASNGGALLRQADTLII